ncbi:hypothetical protein [Rhizobium mulingense]|uniref:hypothetical protein n=1 Tax=Rhizobium mulingense TaxID=3031128 RepID=UPI002B473BEB|nr:hypothetical protein [Rhizobium sp. MJ21]MEB3045992.1 hypothetical protein [Rhizobium sp. MJ21]
MADAYYVTSLPGEHAVEGFPTSGGPSLARAYHIQARDATGFIVLPKPDQGRPVPGFHDPVELHAYPYAFAPAVEIEKLKFRIPAYKREERG